MEHRGKQQQPYRKMGQTARNLVVAATNNAFQPTTIATYLTQMWAANIMQTVGWALVGALYSTSSSRSCECTCHNHNQLLHHNQNHNVQQQKIVNGNTQPSVKSFG